MTIIKNNGPDRHYFSPSVNILRDENSSLFYIPTPNSRLVYNQLINDYKVGVRSFNIIGAYGSGKSSFIWALEKNLNGKTEFFGTETKIENVNGFRFVNVVGEYYSLISTFAERVGIDPKSDYRATDIIQKLDEYYEKVKETGKGLAIVIDEFGKFLEFAAQNNADYELYFVQQLAEFVNNTDKEILFITTLHQDFNAYGLNLKKSQRHEWEKVKGRLQELNFNEPVEQLLYLASRRLSDTKPTKTEPKNFKKLFHSIKQANAFPLRDYFNEEIAHDIWPFDILAASCLTLALQRYGQNERSLFSFIESNDFMGINDFDSEKAPYYNLSWVYDYLIHNYHSLLTTKYNPHYTQWSAIRSSLERIEIIDNNHEAYNAIIKAIGLLDLFASDSAKIDKTFLTNYSKYALRLSLPETIIDDLESRKIIRFVKHRSRYKIFEGTDLDIELAIDEAGNLIEGVSNTVSYLNEYFDFPYLPAKAIYYEKGTPRFYEFKLSEEPINEAPIGQIDGFVNLIFNDNLTEAEIIDKSYKCSEAILFGWYQRTGEVKSLIYEIEKAKKAREQNITDRVAVREFDSIIQHQIQLLNYYIIGSLHNETSPVKWFFQGKEVPITGQKQFNRQLSEICSHIYYNAPELKSELVNKTKITGAISTARRNLLHALFDKWHEPDLGFKSDKFPPEKTIYLSLLKNTSLHGITEEGIGFNTPNVKIEEVWRESVGFLNSTKKSQRNLKEFVDILSTRPYKLKKGVIDFWLPIFLLIKRDDFALFGREGYIPILNVETLDLIVKSPKDYAIKAYRVDGVRLNLFNKYRSLLNHSPGAKPNNENFIQTIRPFLTFYRNLPEYAKQTNRLSKEALALRKAIKESKDPEETFFESFPVALGYRIKQLEKDSDLLETYVIQIQNSFKELRTCYDELITRFETLIQQEIIGDEISFPNYKAQLQKRFSGIKEHLLLQNQKTLYQRIYSHLDDRNGWLNSLAQAVIGKPLNAITDEDEKKLFDKFPSMIHELDNFTDLSTHSIDPEKENAVKLEVTDLVEGLSTKMVRLPKSKVSQVENYERTIKERLGSDNQLNIFILIKILKEQIRNE